MPQRKKCIAVVEDNPDNMLLVRIMLADRYTLREFTTGEGAYSGILRQPPDLILMDITLPDTDGVSVMQRLRQHAQAAEIPMVALTAHAMRGDREHLLAAGFDFYIAKPVVDARVLQDAVAQYLEVGLPAQ